MHIVVQVALPVPLPHLFNYLAPSNTPVPVAGARARVSFRNRKMIGIAVKILKTKDLPSKNLKQIEHMIDDQSLFSPTLWQILHWSAQYYHFPLGIILNHALPLLLRQGKTLQEKLHSRWIINKAGLEFKISSLQNAPKQQQALAALRSQPIYSRELKEKKISTTILEILRSKGLCDLSTYESQITDWHTFFLVKDKNLKLNNEQEHAVQAMINNNHHYVAWLLAGTTGSGKTEVYLNMLENVLSHGKQALVLVPEINLTPQTIARFRERFNIPIDVLHSSLNHSKRLAVWLRARSGESAIIIGTRSALFTPLARPGVIIIDEEHDNSYKQQDGWRYQARDLAVLRAYKENIPIIMGSATPALETLYNVRQGKYQQLNLTQRAGNAKIIHQQLVDLKGQQLQYGLTSILLRKIRKHLNDDNQVLLFLNRRGFSPIFICHDCGWLAKCQGCERYYTLHQHYRQLRCHYCNNHRQLPDKCLNCTSVNLISIGVGTEQLEQQLTKLFPDVPVSRIDRDTTGKKGALEKYLSNINRGGKHILIGTQMLAKGHHFPDVTLVGLLDIDGALFSTNFRAAEHFAQLYTQVAGRAGRANKDGEVLLQTYHPKHPLLTTLLSNDYFNFAEQTLLERKLLQLPPWTNHALFRAEDLNNEKVVEFLIQLRKLLDKHPLKDQSTWLMGPVPSLTQKRNGYWRWQLLLQHPSRKYLHQLLSNLLPLIKTIHSAQRIRWTLDIDPIEN
ncbi:primosomal protein N' [Pantoea sp. Mhis]|uniref:primosomal protein N' n=1 Tax=Pantoea sp. Mhis TaxID=2576759 RepID=UPI0013572BA5|nr:primosomal protein N' [Pantoea sp. Mhis]MXP56638.1 primosomal protein N' [Pantoea sp. Mhis]